MPTPQHLHVAERVVDNRQSEAMNDRLEGYSPLVRVPPGSFLFQRAKIAAILERARPDDRRG